MNNKTLLLVDGSSYLYRAFHALAPLTSPQGEPTGALFGVLNMLRRLRTEVAHEYCAVVFDAKGKNFRHALYPEYKANRPPMPEDLRPQTEWVRELTALFGWTVLVVDDVEADDVMATLARQGEAAGMNVIMSTGDKDMAQLVNPHITMVDTMKNAVYDAAGVQEKFGVTPAQIVDYLTLIGDTSDNVPGVDKCGPKTAVKWLGEYTTLDNLIAHADQIGGKVGENLRAALPRLPLSKQLITLKEDVDLSAVLPQGLADLRHREPQWAALVPRLRHFGLRSLLKEAESRLTSSPDLLTAPSGEAVTPSAPEAAIAAAPAVVNYHMVTDDAALDALCARLHAAKTVGFDTETTSLDVRAARLIGMSFAFAPGDAAYVPLAHSITAAPQQLELAPTLARLKPFLENPALHKIGQNLKYDRHVLQNHEIDLQGISGDAMLASYIVESYLGHGLDELAARHLDLTTIKYEDLCGKGAKQISFAEVALDDARDYACQDADFALRLEAHLVAQMDTAQRKMYRELELPVSDVLYHMERYGVLIDKTELQRQSHELGAAMMRLEEAAYAAAGQKFNLNSPKQLQEILFDKLGISTRGVAKTASGGYSTNEAVLEKLAYDYPLPKIILENRALSKLKSTYTDKLPTLIDRDSGRVHTTYAQAVAITGRLASNNPNLQNIPIRSEEGRRVRRAFIAAPGCHIVSADYSQIELRIMAHLSGDETLIAAFAAGEDIHRRTAAEVFGIAAQDVNAEQRRYAKTINFGLIYGMGQYGLAKSLGIDNDAAKNFIERYFARYPAVAEYMERTKQRARETGYVETLFGRRLYLPEITSSNGNRRAGAERAAINAPMQGTASDLIKRAMIAVQQQIVSDKLASRLIMQVHDELVLEVADAELDAVTHWLPELMAKAGTLKVPLVAEVGVGANWDEAH